MNAVDLYNSDINIRWECRNQDDHPYSSYMLQPYGTCWQLIGTFRFCFSSLGGECFKAYYSSRMNQNILFSIVKKI